MSAVREPYMSLNIMTITFLFELFLKKNNALFFIHIVKSFFVRMKSFDVSFGIRFILSLNFFYNVVKLFQNYARMNIP